MKAIPLTRGMEALVDDEDYDYLMQWTWQVSDNGYGNLYAVCSTRRVPGGREKPPGGSRSMHRMVARRAGKLSRYIDHENGDGLDNQRNNLRPATNSLNGANRGTQRNNTSGFKGVTFDTSRNKWRAQMAIGGKNTNLGRFNSAEDAAKAYDEAAKKHFGEFAYLNFS